MNLESGIGANRSFKRPGVISGDHCASLHLAKLVATGEVAFAGERKSPHPFLHIQQQFASQLRKLVDSQGLSDGGS
jgi:hypothetical protein